MVVYSEWLRWALSTEGIYPIKSEPGHYVYARNEALQKALDKIFKGR